MATNKEKDAKAIEEFAKHGEPKNNYKISQSYQVKTTMTGKLKILKLK